MTSKPDDQPKDPFDSRRRAPRVTRRALLILLFSTPAGLIAGVNGADKSEVLVIIIGPILALLLSQPFVEPFHDKEDARDHAGRGLIEAMVVSQGLAAKQFVVAMCALLAGVALAVGATWMKAAWLCLPVGMALVVLLRRHRGRSGFLAAFAFVGIPLVIYGIVVGGLQLLAQR